MDAHVMHALVVGVGVQMMWLHVARMVVVGGGVRVGNKV